MAQLLEEWLVMRRQRLVRKTVLLLVALATSVDCAFGRNYLSCSAKQVVIVYAPTGSSSSSSEEKFGFWIDDPTKSVVLADGTPLVVRRIDDVWLSAARGDMTYELNRQTGNLTYASSTTKDNASTVTIGSGQCRPAAGPAE